MLEVLKGLKPEKLWELFAQILNIPHGSKNEAALAAHLRQVAEKAGFAERAGVGYGIKSPVGRVQARRC